MAGVGFELRKLFNSVQQGQKLKVLAISGMVTAGPVLLAMVMVLALLSIMQAAGIAFALRERFMGFFYYSIAFSNMLGGGLCLIVTRHVADLLFEDNRTAILPAFYGAALVLAGVFAPFGLFFILANTAPLIQNLLVVGLFYTLGLIWLEMVFLSAVRAYRRIVLGFILATSLAVLIGFLLIRLGLDPVFSALLACQLGFGIMLLFYLRAVQLSFPTDIRRPSYDFINTARRYPQLIWIGTFNAACAFVHCFTLWVTPIAVQITSIVRYVPFYDVAVFYSFLHILPMMVIFSVFTEVDFAQSYNQYFHLITHRGNYADIQLAHRELIAVLKRELQHMFELQLLLTILLITVGSSYVPDWLLPTESIPMFRLLTLGYMVFGLVHCLIVIMLYFDDRGGALWSSGVLFTLSVLLSLVFLPLGSHYYGLGFLAASVVAAIVAGLRLAHYTSQMNYYIFCSQPMFQTAGRGPRHPDAKK